MSDAYISLSASQSEDKCPGGQFDPACSTPYQNYIFPAGSLDTDAPEYPDVVLVVGSTTGIGDPEQTGGGVARAVLRVDDEPRLEVLDRIPYIDPNVPCKHLPVANWQLIKFGNNLGWLPRRVDDGNLPQLPAPGPQRTSGGCSG